MALALAGLYFVRFERLAREQEVNQEQLRIAAIAFETQDGMVITNAQAKVLKVNLAFSEITGYSAEEVIGQGLKCLMSANMNQRSTLTFICALKRQACLLEKC